ncbi:hypothetical protein GQ53DRAFT_800349 [Thozetella sp. PMI_491]|nr:hypothetical protein GQ53DRAFT_800349 [Thozetella sp. PMI_491]
MGHCGPCDRSFPSGDALQQHLRTSRHHVYDCTRCQKHFDSHGARDQHVRDSPRHNICDDCPQKPDFDTESELEEHQEEVHHCCTDCDQEFGTSEQLAQHDVSKHNMCNVCGNYFDSPSNLASHRLTHAERIVECPGCPRKFPTNSAMILHLEAGTCESGVNNEWVGQIASQCHRSRCYTSDDPEFDFMCPTCETPFSYISGVLQHVESNYCKEDVAHGTSLWKFLRFLQSRF